jgi:hemerythrin-like metal-binding protein
MAFYEWTPRLSVGIGSIDRQHRTLIDYINTLADAVATGTNAKTVIGTTLNNLVTYTKMHFMYEEMLFDRFGYAESAEHKAHHVSLVDRVAAYADRFKAGDVGLGGEVLEFLKDWLNHHILKDDVAYSGFLIEHGVS